MATLQQPCPACGRDLELPAEAIGRLAKCPACDVTFTISEPSDPDTRPEAGDPTESDAADTGLETAQEFANDDAESPGSLQIVTCPIENVLSKAKAIFLARWSQFAAPIGIFLIASLIFLVIPVVVLRGFWLSGFPRLTIFLWVCWAPVAFLFSTYSAVAFARLALAVAKNEPVVGRKVAPPQPVLIRALVVALSLATLGGFAGITMYSLMAVSEKVGGQPVSRVLSVFGFVFATGLTLILLWQIWAWIYACADDRATSIGSLRAACAITAQNKLTSFFLVLIAVVLALLGTLMCLVGHLVTAPLTVLIFAVAYLLMTGQSVADPNDV